MPALRIATLAAALTVLAAGIAHSQIRTLRLPGGSVDLETSGQGCAVVLVGGGGSMDRRQWDAVYPGLARHYRVVRYDPRGSGRSDSPAEPFSHLEDLLTLLDTLGIRRAALVGLSSGAALALDFALYAPHRVTALVLAAPSVPGIARSAEMEERVRGFIGAAERGAGAYVKTLLGDRYFVPAPARPEAREMARTLILENYRLVDAALARPLTPPAAGRLAEVRAPVLVLVGEADHPDVRRRAQVLQEGIPGSRLEDIPAAGHLINLENPEALTDRAERFLRAAVGNGS